MSKPKCPDCGGDVTIKRTYNPDYTKYKCKSCGWGDTQSSATPTGGETLDEIILSKEEAVFVNDMAKTVEGAYGWEAFTEPETRFVHRLRNYLGVDA